VGKNQSKIIVINNNKNKELKGVVKPQSIDIDKNVLNRGHVEDFTILAVNNAALQIVVVVV